LLGNIRRGLADDLARRQSHQRMYEVQTRLDSLTDKERQVLELIQSGCSNRDMADRLSLSIRAVEDRRARVMKKMRASSLVDLMSPYGNSPALSAP
jgi:FixJ family two-component response regulator